MVHMTVPMLHDLPKVTQHVRGRAGPGALLPCKPGEDAPSQSLAESVLPLSPLREAALVPPLAALAKGTQMTQAWGLEAGILVPAWLWGPALPQPALNVGHQDAAAQPPPPTALLPRPRGWEK